MLAAGLFGFRWPLMAVTTNYFVEPNGSDAAERSGLDWANAFLTIGYGVGRAADNDTIIVSNGEYKLAAAIALNKGILPANFTGNPVNTVIDGRNTFRCLDVTHAGAVVNGFAIQRMLYEQ